MEDRENAGLYLEMVTGPIEPYLQQRLPDVLALEGATRATWWRNAHRDRTDLPRRLAEFDHLVAYEVAAHFRAPSRVAADISTHHFVRTQRPGQGTLSGRPTIGLSLVLISPRDEAGAQDLRDWGDFVHIRHIAQASVPGYTMITPYVNAQADGHPRFLHWYEMDCEDPEHAFKMMTPMVTARLGGTHHASWAAWANHPQLRIMYVNTFARLGERSA